MGSTFFGAYQRIDVTPQGLFITYIEKEFDHDSRVIARFAGRVERWAWADIKAFRWNRYWGDDEELLITAAPGVNPELIHRVCVESNLSRRQWRRFARRVAELTGGRLVVEPRVPKHCRPWWRRPHRVGGPRGVPGRP